MRPERGKSPTDNAWSFLYGKKMLAGSAEATVEHKVRCRGPHPSFRSGPCYRGSAELPLFHDTSMVSPSHATLRKSASQAGVRCERGCVVQTPPGEAEGKDRFKREIGKAMQVRPADASGGEQFQHTRGKSLPVSRACMEMAKAANIVRPGRGGSGSPHSMNRSRTAWSMVGR